MKTTIKTEALKKALKTAKIYATGKAPGTQAENHETAKEETTEKPEQEKEPEKKEEKQRPSLPPCRAFVFSSKDVSSRPGEVLATVKNALMGKPAEPEKTQAAEQKTEQPSREGKPLNGDPIVQAMKRAMESAKRTEPAERPSVRASEPAPAEPMEAPQPQPSESSAAEPEKSGWEIGTYTTKKGKVKTAIRFFQPPTPAQIDALKKAFYWEYNGTWNGSPRKLPEIFKH